jgi:hypothetical protein
MTGLLDRLVACGAITGYTREGAVDYLIAKRPTLTYSMYAGGRASRANRARFIADMTRLRGRVNIVSQVGHLAVAGGRIQRTNQVRMVVEFDHDEDFEKAIRLIQREYVAGHGREAARGSWLYPDVRVTGVRGPIAGTFQATAHHAAAIGDRFVVLTPEPAPALPGMSTSPVLLLDCWRAILSARPPVGDPA